MLPFLRTLLEKPDVSGFHLKTLSCDVPFDKLAAGVDNIRYDVLLSPGFCRTLRRFIRRLFSQRTAIWDVLDLDPDETLAGEKESFQRLCREVLIDGLNRAKSYRLAQIDYLVQVAVAKMIIQEVRVQYDRMLDRLKASVREFELSENPGKAIARKKELADLTDDRKSILIQTGSALFQYFTEIQEKDLRDMRQVNFGPESVFPSELFTNPMLHIEEMDEYIMMESYDILLGRRVDDPDKYEYILALIKGFFQASGLTRNLEADAPAREDDPDAGPRRPCAAETVDQWIMQPENVDALFNYFETRFQRRILKKQGGKKQDVTRLNARARRQKRLLKTLRRRLNQGAAGLKVFPSADPSCNGPDIPRDGNGTAPPPRPAPRRNYFDGGEKSGLISRIVACYEMQPVCFDYCPPLAPNLIAQFIASPKTRKAVIARLKRSQFYYGRPFPAKPLLDVVRNVKKLKSDIIVGYLIRFLKGFFRFHRDVRLSGVLQEAMEKVNFISDDRMIALSRANKMLYEFHLGHEQTAEEKRIINHVIVKADVRGSTDITHKMTEKGLNPASFFSLNFFDPISDVLSEYGAAKVFVEGDAIILAIYEREESPDGWYAAARACGLAMNILAIVRHYNRKSQNAGLPVIEIGVGISYQYGAPTFLFDGDKEIMISGAINLADRMSGCVKRLRKRLKNRSGPFNLYVFQSASEEEQSATTDDLSMRYNVNGIELGKAAFEKLSREIDLKPATVSLGKRGGKATLYAGMFPTTTGHYHRLLIREARIPKIDGKTLKPIAMSDRVYYEVCTDPALFKRVKPGG